MLKQRNMLNAQIEERIASIAHMIDYFTQQGVLINVDNTKPVKPKLCTISSEIWAILAQRCHPDKTKDVVLLQLFKQARKYVDEGDSVNIIFSYLEMTEHLQEDTLTSKLIHNSRLYEKGIYTLQQRLAFIENSEYGKLFNIFKIDPQQAIQVYREKL